MPTKIVTGTAPHGTVVITPQEKIRAWMQVGVSALALFIGFAILVSSPTFLFHHNFDEATKRLAAGWIGAVIGYWLS